MKKLRIIKLNTSLLGDEIERKCPVCNGLVFGRSDKRYCTQACKNEHHRTAKKQTTSRLGYAHDKVRRNLILMEGVMGPRAKKMIIHRDELVKRGFDISICTNSKIHKNYLQYEICGYLYYVKRNGLVVIERTEEIGDYLPGFFERYVIDFPDVVFEEGTGDDDLEIGFCRLQE